MRRKFFHVALSGILAALLLVLALPPTPAAAWFSFPTNSSQHSRMAQDSLTGLGWTSSQIGQVPYYADYLDLYSAHPSGSNHRITLYQDMYESFGGDACPYAGAESWATNYLTQAKQSYLNNNKSDGDKYLGYAIHYIQDSVCPAHVFPLKDAGLFIGAHYNFESDYNSYYKNNTNQIRTAVQNAEAAQISSPEDLMNKMIAAAGIVNTFSCGYVREDGATIGNPTSRGYAISITDVIESVKMASGLAKGAALWATAATVTAPVVTLHPAGQSVSAGSNVTFSAAASGNPAPTVQWQTSSNQGSTWQNIAGATSNSLTFTTTSAQDGYQYRAEFTNSAGSVPTNPAILTVTAATNPPTITGVSPAYGTRGQSLTVTTTGTNLNGATLVSFGPGITVRSFTVTDSTTITAKIAINKKAALGWRELKVTTPAGSDSLPAAFEVR